MDRYTAGAASNAAGLASQVAPAPGMTGVAHRLTSLRECIERFDGLGVCANRIANRVAGSFPEAKGEGQQPRPVPNGLADELLEIIEGLHARATRIEDALGRTETALG